MIIIPCYNDQNSLNSIVESISYYFPYLDILVVDDGSLPPVVQPDLLNVAVLRHSKNLGLGEAVRSGIRYAQKYEYSGLIKIDADGQMDVSFLPLFVCSIEQGADIVHGHFDKLTPISIRFDDYVFTKIANFYSLTPLGSILAEYRGYSKHMFSQILNNESITRWGSPFVTMQLSTQNVISIDGSVKYIKNRSFRGKDMLQLRKELIKQCAISRKNNFFHYLLLLPVSFILGVHMCLNLMINPKQNSLLKRK